MAVQLASPEGASGRRGWRPAAEGVRRSAASAAAWSSWDYDINLADTGSGRRRLAQYALSTHGCQRNSGMKRLNGVELSVMDGWWRGLNGRNGWAIGAMLTWKPPDDQDLLMRQSLDGKRDHSLFYDRDPRISHYRIARVNRWEPSSPLQHRRMVRNT
jgi:hypothetical protein